jgi:hypothetical protein
MAKRTNGNGRRNILMNYHELNGIWIRDGFNQFHKDNPHIYQAFERASLKAIEKGREKISAKLIINWIRWNEYLTSTDQNFKINDAYHAYYSRLFVHYHPEYKDKFEFRKLRNEVNGPYMKVEKDGQISFL